MTGKIQLKTESDILEVEVADTFFKRAWGLSRREKGKMLFIFSRNTRAKIDMALLSHPLYLYFLNENKEVISIKEAKPWSWNPKTWKLYAPNKKYRYLLESFEDLEISKGDTLEFSRSRV